ncbi:MAG: ornithine cyclodeaminase family protein [Planctomycetota bacterium]|jgi:alanine dehydrogenase
MAAQSTYLITQRQVENALSIADAVDAVEAAFRAYGEGRAQMPPKSYLHFDKGDLRSMPAYLPDLGLAAVKNVNVHPANRDLPSVMATVTLFDPDTGFPLAIMDGTHLTAMRTGAAGGIAARHLARADSEVACLVGAGRQAEAQLAALMVVLPGIRTVLVYDEDAGRARDFAERAAAAHGVEVSACALEEAVPAADVVTTVTPARQPLIARELLRPGAHVNAIGADAPGKQELAIDVLRGARLVVDSWEQASHGGEINVAVAQGRITRRDVHADIGEIVAGKKPGRQSAEEITVFDSTGLAVQDLACAAHVYAALTCAGGARPELGTINFLERG